MENLEQARERIESLLEGFDTVVMELKTLKEELEKQAKKEIETKK